MSDYKMQPESLMMSHGYKPELSEGAVKCPIFQTSTFVFQKAEDGKAFFEVAYGLREKEEEEMWLLHTDLGRGMMPMMAQERRQDKCLKITKSEWSCWYTTLIKIW